MERLVVEAMQPNSSHTKPGSFSSSNLELSFVLLEYGLHGTFSCFIN